MKTRIESDPNFFKSIQNTRRTYQNLTLSCSALGIASFFIGIIKSIKDNEFSPILLTPYFLMACGATSYIYSNDPCTLLFENISEEDKNNLNEQELRESCDYIRTNIIGYTI